MAPKTDYHHHHHRREDDSYTTTTFHTARPLSSRARLLVVGQKSGNKVVSARESPVRLRTRRKASTPSRRRGGEGAKYYHGGSSSRRSVSPRRRSVSPRHKSGSRYYNDMRSESPRRDRASNSSSRQRSERRSPSPTKYHHRSRHHHNDRERSSSPTKHRRHYDDHDHDHRGRSSPRRERSQIQEDDNFSGDEGFELERRTPSFWGKTRQPKITSIEPEEDITAFGHDSKHEEHIENHNNKKKKKKKKKKDKNAERCLVEEVEMMLQPERSHRGGLQTQVAMRSKVKRVNKNNYEKDSKHVQDEDNNNVGMVAGNDAINQSTSFLGGEKITQFMDTIKRSTSILDEEFIESIKKKTSFLDEENITQFMDTIKSSTSIVEFGGTIQESYSMLEFGTIKKDTSILDEENLDQVLDELAQRHDKKWDNKKLKEDENMLSSIFGKSGSNDAKNALTNGDGDDDDDDCKNNSDSEEGTNSHSELTDGTGSFDSLSITNEKNSCFSCFDRLLIEDEWDINKNKYLLENGA